MNCGLDEKHLTCEDDTYGITPHLSNYMQSFLVIIRRLGGF